MEMMVRLLHLRRNLLERQGLTQPDVACIEELVLRYKHDTFNVSVLLTTCTESIDLSASKTES